MGAKHVLVHLDDGALERVVPGDSFLVRANGRGMRVEDVPEIACHSLSPALWHAWTPELRDGVLAVRVTRMLPPEVVGMGSGRVSAVTSVALQTGIEEAWKACGSATSSPSAIGTRRTTPATAKARSRSRSSPAATARSSATGRG